MKTFHVISGEKEFFVNGDNISFNSGYITIYDKANNLLMASSNVTVIDISAIDEEETEKKSFKQSIA